MSEIVVEIGSWSMLGGDAARIRDAVFVREQRIPAQLELDDEDHTARHVVAYRIAPDAPAQPRRAIATGRLLPDGGIGRLAVLSDARGGGVGSRVLAALLDEARARGDRRVRLYAQQAAVPFYLRHGFEPAGEPFEAAGMPHQEMTFSL